ncbi:oligomeric, coiled-coil, peripheral membrane protein [Recurvomyces mirabilis]|uniref:Autophagy-related protein 11 n=1 Tax=Recurvomyces mirabilis TaxID=574656 RepID=A0AAE0WJT7_9PEZI|nr:oligomeric, coiled-coil, peripheral membrane protein [Recurvomyces mirabilis]KAK5150901.1 oligomeric, coiled-coil, peripheral membrane protein [Recurvomyces mirabilis]
MDQLQPPSLSPSTYHSPSTSTTSTNTPAITPTQPSSPVTATHMSVAVQVFIGHTGQRLSIDPSVTNTVEALRSWIAQQAAIEARNQILLTANGKAVRTQNLLTDTEVFVFDSSRLQGQAAASPSSSGATSSSGSHDFNPGPAPDTIADQDDLQAWQNLFKLRRNWANAILKGCDKQAQQAERYLDEQAIIERSVAVAVTSLKQHTRGAEQKYAHAEQWLDAVQGEQLVHLEDWERHLGSLRSIPARAEFLRFIQPFSPASRRLSQQAGVATLQGFVDVPATEKAATASRTLLSGLVDQVGNMRRELDAVTKQTEDLQQATEQHSSTNSTSEPMQLLEEIQLVVKKIASDLQHVQSLPAAAASVSQASKMALLHTRNFLPALTEHSGEMNELVRRMQQLRDSAAQTSSDHMRTLANTESRLSELYSKAKSLEIADDDQHGFTTLAIVSRLPSVYGQLLIESVRRREWVAKMKRDSATLQEEVATYQEEEDKRRKKWIRSVEDVVSLESLQSNVLGIELSLQNEGGSWPMVTRDELKEYTDTLLEVFGPGPVTEELDQAIKDLDKPTRKQIKHARAFKNGSMHEAAFGDTSLLLRGDEQYKVLREANSRLEEDNKAQKSRVRKLEDLLHRQSQLSRASNGDMFSPQSASFDRTTSPLMPTPQHSIDDTSRNNPIRQRRPSSAQAIEEKKLARRVVDLEAELQAHKDEAANRKSSDAETQKQVEEAVSTKKDLMENMNAQQQEFVTERRSLERELNDAKERVYGLEIEIDRLVGSRDDERTGTDARAVGFQEEIARLKEDAMGHAARAATEHDARAAIERKLELAESATVQVEAELRQLQIEKEEVQELEAKNVQLLTAAHNHLIDSADTPSSLASLALALEDLAQRSASHVKELADAVAFAKSENESLWASNERQKTELSHAAEKQIEDEEKIRQAQEAFSAEWAKIQSLEQQLIDEQEQLRTLREKFAEGETGSEVLRQRISEEEGRANKLASELAEAKSHVTSMDVELMRMQKKHRAYHTSAETASARLDKRAERAKDVSHRLYTQNSRLGRLLEQLGLALSFKDDGTMLIERASKLAASTLMSDTTGEIRPGNASRSMSLTSPPPTRKSSTTDDPPDVAAVHWADAQTPDDEAARFETFLQQVARFNIDYFSEQVNKRLRDYEYTAKKFNKEWRESSKRAEAYKERSLKLKSESHAKIAVKDFKEGDLALFLPTRGQAKGAWAAFNINCPHYFLAEKEGMRLGSRDFIIVRISKVEQKVVDLSRSLPSHTDGKSIDEASEAPSFDDDNPFDLSDGLTWWMVHATEERGVGGAPSTPGLGKSTVAAANVDAKGSIRTKRNSKSEDASKVLNKSLDSRRSSSASKKGVAGTVVPVIANAGGAGSPLVGEVPAAAVSLRSRSESQTSLRPPPTPAPAPAAGGTGTSGLGIIADNSDAQSTTDEQARKPSPSPAPIMRARAESRSASPARTQVRARSKSPSKSVRSLQRHLEPKSPAKTPVKKAGWESLWQAEFALESPSKSGK